MNTGRRLMNHGCITGCPFCGFVRKGRIAGTCKLFRSGCQGQLRYRQPTAQVREVPVSIEANGTFEASEASDLTPPAEGTVISTPVDIGASVESGDVVVRLDDRDARLRLEQAKALVEQAEASLRQAESRIGLMAGSTFDPLRVPEVQARRRPTSPQKSRNHSGRGGRGPLCRTVSHWRRFAQQLMRNTSRRPTARSLRRRPRSSNIEAALNTARQGFQGVGAAQASLASARAQLAIAQKGVDDTVVRAPFAGQVTARPISVGEYVSKSSKLVTIVRSNPMKLSAADARSQRVTDSPWVCELPHTSLRIRRWNLSARSARSILRSAWSRGRSPWKFAFRIRI